MGSRFAEGFLTRILYMALIYNMNYEYKSSYLNLLHLSTYIRIIRLFNYTVLISYDYTESVDAVQISLPAASTPQLPTESPRNLAINSPFKHINLFQLRETHRSLESLPG